MPSMPTVRLAGPIESLKVIQSPTIVIDLPESPLGDTDEQG